MERNPHWNPDAMYPDPEWDIMATPSDACREYARNVGADKPECKWILTDYDTFEANPYYNGPPCLGSVNPDDPDMDFLDLHAACGRKCFHGFGDPVFGPNKYEAGPSYNAGGDDDIPF